jgi:CBS domain-containing protein
LLIGRTGDAVLSLPIKEVMERKKLLTAPPQTTVAKAAKLMAQRGVGAIMVVDRKRLAGIFTERDALFRVIAQGLDYRTTRLVDVMTPEPTTVSQEETLGYALLIMHERSFRHLPVIEKGKLVGIVSARYALDPDLEEFVAESQRRKHILRGSSL